MHLEEFEPPKFSVGDPRLVEYLNENGYVVVASVATPDEVTAANALLWEFLEPACRMKQFDSSTWTDENFCKIGSTRNGILAYSGINHSKFLWYIRRLPSVRLAFEQIFSTTDVITSYDGANIFRPWHAPEAPTYSKTHSGWYHVDQGKTLRGLNSVQGLVTLTDSNAETGGFCVIPGSHVFHDELVDLAAVGDRNYLAIPPSFHALADRQILVKCSAGDMILWDSRTIHCNNPSIEDPIHQPADKLLRAVGYVCMTPAEWATDEVIDKRALMFEYGIGSTHWPHLVPFSVTEDETRSKKFIITDISEDQRMLIVGRKHMGRFV